MKPRSNREREIVALSHNLRPLTKAQKTWALNETIEHQAYRLPVSRMATCMTCGHTWKVEGKADTCRCPHCHRTLQVVDTKRRTAKAKTYFNILTTVKGYQVLRIFMMEVKMEKGKQANPVFVEIGSYWWNEKGVKSLIAIQRTLGYWMDSFACGSPTEIRTDNDVFRQLADQFLYPEMKTIPTLTRNGFSGAVEGIAIHDLVNMLLTSPIAETLLKSGDNRMLRYYNTHKMDVERYWASYKIAKRAGYTITEIGMWYDYLRMLERFGKDVKSPSLICPKSLRTEHDRYVKKVNRIREAERREAERQLAKADQEKFTELKSRFFGLCIHAGDFEFKTIDTIDDYYEIGNRLSICIASSRYYVKEQSLILVAYRNGEIAEVVEISLETMKVIQCHGHHNQDTENHQRIIDLANANTLPIRKRMTA